MTADKLKGKVAIVTGASSGIGFAIAEALASNGAKVGLLARRKEKLENLEQTIRSKGGSAVAVSCDVSKREEVFSAVETVRKEFGKIDILVNNAGVAKTTMVKNCNVDDWLQVVDTNVVGTLHCYAATLQDMMDKKSGHIVNISSIAGRQAFQCGSPYAGSKFFMQGHSAGIRQELASLGIKVTVLQPGITKTELLHAPLDPDVAAYFAKPEFQKAFSGSEPVLESEDIAAAAIFALTQEDRVGVNEMMIEPRTIVFNRT